MSASHRMVAWLPGMSGTITSAVVIDTLRYFRRRFGPRLLIVWDLLQAHRARATKRFLAAHTHQFAMIFLPTYAPELNPEEQCNAWVKRDMENALPATIDELASLARRRFRRLQRHPTMIVNFFRHAGLDVCGLS